MSEYTDRGRRKGKLFIGVRYRQTRGYSAHTSTLGATIFIGNRKWQTSGVKLEVEGRPLLSPHLYIVFWPQRPVLSDLAPGYYVQPGEYSVPEGRFKNAFTNLDQAVAHGRATMKELLAASRALQAMGVGQ